jgi:hypothetical protein
MCSFVDSLVYSRLRSFARLFILFHGRVHVHSIDAAASHSRVPFHGARIDWTMLHL